MAKLSFADIIIAANSYADTLPGIKFDLNYLPQETLGMPMRCMIVSNHLYYDEMQNVWYQRYDGRVTVGPVGKMISEMDYPMSIFLPLDH